ncbi:MAG: transcriptional repressor [Spirochaetaceae bacterium]|nr:transcriptional repressor [Spirochaetaceae bacterium]
MIYKKRKHSAKRDAILRVLTKTDTHPGAQWVYDQLKPLIPDLSLATVYRNLRLFRKEGKALFVGVVRGEERFDGVVEPHPHLVCSHCGRVIDLPCPEDQVVQGTLEIEGFTVDCRRTVFYGSCPDCGPFKEDYGLDRC